MVIKNLKIESLSYNGFGVARYDGKEVRVLGAFPDDIVDAKIYKKGKKIFEGVVDNIKKGSPYRVEPLEKHYLVSSPWQVIDWEKENQYKIDIYKKIFTEMLGNYSVLSDINIIRDRPFGYKNSMEFNLVDKNGRLKLGLQKRGRDKIIEVDGNRLANDFINKTATQLMDFLSTDHDICIRDIKYVKLISNRLGEVLIGICVKNDSFLSDTKLDFFSFINSHSNSVRGFVVYNQKQDILGSFGTSYISEIVRGRKISFSVNDFFQSNIAVFEHTLENMKEFVEGEDVLDFYSGVGVIPVALSDIVSSSLMVEINSSSVKKIMFNIKGNKIDTEKHRAVYNSAEDNLKYITKDKVLVVNPPREGLSDVVIERILKVKPKRIVYLSCKPYTQILNIEKIIGFYQIKHISLYNFFPRTNHIESLMVLDVKKL